MATFNKFQQFVEDLGSGVHDFRAAGHTVKVYLTNTAPNASTHATKSDLAGITEQNGYSAEDVQNDLSESGGTASVTGVDVTWTGTGAGFGPFRYAVLYNDTPTSPADPLIGWWDYTSSISIAAGESFTVDFGASILTIA